LHVCDEKGKNHGLGNNLNENQNILTQIIPISKDPKFYLRIGTPGVQVALVRNSHRVGVTTNNLKNSI
jgi:hypothetical protein